MRSFKIGSIEIGIDKTPLVIPEIGINHGGCLEIAKMMVDAVVEGGAKIIKHQTHIIEDEMSSAAKSLIPGNSIKSIYDVMKECALAEEDELELMRYSQSKGLVYISTPFSRAAAERLEGFGVAGYKIGSGEMNNHPLIKHIAAFGKPMIVSTGMNSIASIEKTVEIMENASVPYALLHTTNLYPTMPHQVRLGAMKQMMEWFPHVPVGLSDHTVNNYACIAAVAMGASVIERHFTDRKNRLGNDIVCSMDVKELKDLITASEEIYLMRGGEKTALDEEKVTIDFAFATVVAISDITKGEILTKENVWVKRPGTGELPAEDYEKILGKVANCDICADTHIKLEMLDGLP